MAEKRVPPLKPFVMPDNLVRNDTKKILIAATWRTGSSFLGDIIQSAPGVFYSYEPLVFPGSKTSPIELIDEIFRCKFRGDYLEHVNGKNSDNVEFMSRNKRVWDTCSKEKTLCTNPEFVGKLCRHFPVNLIKVVRLRLSDLHEAELDGIKVIYLARDPRGVMASRANLTWCQRDPDCNSPARLCDNVSKDLNLITKLTKEKPDRYYFLKFEDLSANVELETDKLFKFLGMKITLPVKVFLNTHTRGGASRNDSLKRDPFSTRRKSDTVAHEWRKKLSKNVIKSVTDVCLDVINYLNYTL